MEISISILEVSRQSLVFVYMTIMVDNAFGMFPMRAIFCLTYRNHNISQKGRKLFYIRKTVSSLK